MYHHSIEYCSLRINDHSLLQFMAFFFNPPPKLALKRDNREIRKNGGKLVNFAFFSKTRKIFTKIHILTDSFKDTCKIGYFIAF